MKPAGSDDKYTTVLDGYKLDLLRPCSVAGSGERKNKISIYVVAALALLEARAWLLASPSKYIIKLVCFYL